LICTATVDASTKNTHTDTRTHTHTIEYTHEGITNTYIDGYLLKRAIREAMHVSYVDIQI